MIPEILRNHRVVLAAVPLFAVIVSLWAAATQGPYYVGENSDPEYVYALNALNIVALRSPIHIDHPGTPLQMLLAGAFVVRHAVSCLTGECRSVIEEVVRNPELYLNFARLVLLAMLAGTILYAGRRVYALSGSMVAAVALQGVIFLFPVTLTSLARVTPEPLLLICSILFILPLFEVAYAESTSDSADGASTDRLALIAGIAFAAGVTSKVTFFPLCLMALVLPTWRHRLRFAAAAGVASFVFILPIMGRLPFFVEWLTTLATHRGTYGGGEAGLPTGQEWIAAVKSMLSMETYFPVWIVALFVFGFLLRKIRIPLWIAGICCLAQFVVVLKHPGARYLIPCFAAAAFGIALVLIHGGRIARIAVAGIVAASLFPSAINVSKWAEKRRYYNTSVAQIQRAIATAGNCRVIGFYVSSDVVSNLLFGDEYTQGLHAPLLQSLYPDATRYHAFGGLFHSWAGVNQLPWLMDQLRAGKCILLQGSVMVESAWPTSTGIERTELLKSAGEHLFLLSLPGIPIQRQTQPSAGTSISAAPAVPGSAATAPAAPPSAVAGAKSVAPPGPGATIIEAEDFSAGNAAADRAVFGSGIGVLTSPKIPASAEYQFNLPAIDNYEIYARYATEGARPVTLLLNGKVVNKEFCGNPTGGYYPAAQRWFPGGVFNLPGGKTTLRLESNGPFPHIDKIALVPMHSPK